MGWSQTAKSRKVHMRIARAVAFDQSPDEAAIAIFLRTLIEIGDGTTGQRRRRWPFAEIEPPSHGDAV